MERAELSQARALLGHARRRHRSPEAQEAGGYDPSMVIIPGGDFRMGTDDDSRADEDDQFTTFA